MSNFADISWFMKYQPKEISEYVFDNPEHQVMVDGWLQNEAINGNLLMSGPAGMGKSSLANVLLHAIIKSPHDFKKMKSRSVDEVDELGTWITTKPVKSKKKVVLFEEIDKISKQASTTLKDGYLEKYQSTCTFIATTNFISKIDPALKSRFIHLSFTGTNIPGVIDRCANILTLENIEFDRSQLENFIKLKHKIGLRNIITQLQINSIGGKIDFDSITADASNLEEEVVDLVQKILETVIKTNDQLTKKSIIYNPNTSPISKEWSRITEITQYSKDLDYESIYILMNDKIQYIPIKLTINKYLNELESRKLLNISFLAFIFE
jgi:DNA polymerase III delta prime subunit